MSFDVFVQKFEFGGAGRADERVIREILAPYFKGADRSVLYCSDGTTDLHGADLAKGFMVNHAGGAEIWDVLVRVAQAAHLTIVPVGCPAVVTSIEDIRHLPPELSKRVAVVSSGQELVAVITRRLS